MSSCGTGGLTKYVLSCGTLASQGQMWESFLRRKPCEEAGAARENQVTTVISPVERKRRGGSIGWEEDSNRPEKVQQGKCEDLERNLPAPEYPNFHERTFHGIGAA